MSGVPIEDEALRRRALDQLGAFGPELARAALESGTLEVEPDVLTWIGTTGMVHGQRVTVRVEPELASRVNVAPSALDALTAAVAAAIAMTGHVALAELVVASRVGPRRRPAPYRG